MAPSPLTPAPALWLNRLLAAAALLSAWLLFQVQPMAAKRILPWFGGGAGVWTAALLFFQTALLAGYLYAHLVASRLAPRTQVLVHAGLLAAVTLLLAFKGVLPTDDWKPAGNDLPAWRILVMLTACVGFPYLMLAATAPLAQVWFARANPGRSPYRLYALSNVGSLAALLSYPFLVEPNLGVAHQGVVWSISFAMFALLLAAAGALSLRIAVPANSGIASTDDDDASAVAEPRPVWLQYFFWLALPACASVALLAITNYLCQDVASIPLLWILPLAVYLVTFILTFDSDRWYCRWAWLAGLAVTSFVAVWTWFQGSNFPIWWQVSAHLGLLLCLGMACHGELARMRPTPGRLTNFYLSISAGGALGGLLAAVVAPLLLPDRYELQLSIAAAWLLVLAVLVTDRDSAFYDGRSFKRLLAMAALLISLVTAMATQAVKDRANSIALARNFYGVLEVGQIHAGEANAYYSLVNGRISHGAQYRAPENRRVPTQYYHAESGVGEMLLLDDRPAPRRVGVVGLGTGTLAAYAEAGDEFRFYDINPQVVGFADKYFTFLADARERGAKITIVPGDARLSMEREEPQKFDVLILDAFSGDAIPVHLLTREAFALYLRHLKDPTGVLAVHVSNLHLEFGGVVRAAVDRYKLDAVGVDAPSDGTPAGQRSVWLLLTREAGFFAAHSLGEPIAKSTPERPSVEWTDDYTNVLDILK